MARPKKTKTTKTKTKKVVKTTPDAPKGLVQGPDFMRNIGRLLAGAYYDYQDVRLKTMNQLRAIIRAKHENLDLSKPQKKKSDDEKTHEKKYTDAQLFKLLDQMVKKGEVPTEALEYIEKIQEISKTARGMEDTWKEPMAKYVSGEDIWNLWLKDVKGVSTVLTANLLWAFGYCERYQTVGALWKNTGLHTVCPDCTKEVEIERDGQITKKTIPVTASASGRCPVCGKHGVASKKKKGRSIDYDPRLRTLAWKIADSFIKQNTEPYRSYYDIEKARQLRLMEKHGKEKEFDREGTTVSTSGSLGQAHARAMRLAVKRFLAHYWYVSRKLAGLPTTPLYVEAKLGHPHAHIVMPVFNEKKGIWEIQE